MNFPHNSVSKESACIAGDLGSIPGSEDPLEKEMATYSSILAFRIPWPEKPGRLQSMGSHRVGHDRSDLAAGNSSEENITWTPLGKKLIVPKDIYLD